MTVIPLKLFTGIPLVRKWEMNTVLTQQNIIQTNKKSARLCILW